jgi:uncharacterized membrane protein
MVDELSDNHLFALFVLILALVIVLFGVAMLAVIIWSDHNLGLKMINVFAAMFSAFVGLGSGYLLGRSTRDQRS